MDYAVVGKRVAKIDAVAKATGAARFATDTYLPGMLWARVLRSPHPHARIVSIDTSRAERLPGVRAVITAEDVPDARYGALVFDMGMLARGKVRYIGEPLAAVAAVDKATAAEAIRLIDVAYEELPAVFDPADALRPDAPRVHEELKSYVTLFERTPESMSGNVNYQASIRQGDVAAGFAESDLILEDTFRTSKQHPAYLEPNSTVAAFDSEGRLVIHNTTQRPHVNQAILSALLDLPTSRIRVMPAYVGGGFGAKNRTLSEPIAAALALKAGAPVRFTLSMEEEFTASTTRHPAVITLKTGVKRDGTLVASDMRLVFDCGAYAPTPNAVWLASVTATGPYRIPHTRLSAYSVYTNKMMSGALRGYGGPQVTFAREVQLDRIAAELKIDPVEIRLKNCLRRGDHLHTGQGLVSVNVEETIREAARRAGWGEAKKPEAKGRALGISCAIFPCGGFGTSSVVRMNGDGSAIVTTGAMDMGQGLRTVMAQIAAEELGLTLDRVTVVSGDTDSTPYDVGIFGDRGTHTAGMAVRVAAAEARKEILELAAERLEAAVEDLDLRDNRVAVKGSPGRSLTLKEVFGGGTYRKGGPIIGKASFNPDTPPYDPSAVQGAASRFFSTYTFATVVAEVQVDESTGEVAVLRAVEGNDCGTVINPDGVEGQIDGGMATGLGFAVAEDLVIRDGQVMSTSFLDYRIPTAADMPETERFTVENYDGNGPFGAKGVGNVSVLNLAPAVANAIRSAVGVRLDELPLSPEKIRQGVAELKATGPA
ncbi:MAG: xanthine dehydrogenase family protein molybdopterin-binding subunit [Deltaproteobacteria bacterium]|nr:xanthine dehydrogenase family protein molybdopterin-binding subunit [Deltaproteobacteria bacterium]